MNNMVLALVVAFILLLITFIVVNRIKNGKIRDLQKDVNYKTNRLNLFIHKVNESTADLTEERSKVAKLNGILDNIQVDILEHLVAISNKGNKLNYFQVQNIDKDSLKKFKGVMVKDRKIQVGDKVAYVTRRIKGKTQNVPVTLTISRD